MGFVLELKDPNDVHSEAGQDTLYAEAAGRTGWPGAIDQQYLLTTDNRAHLVIVQGSNTVVRVLRAPREGDYPTPLWNDVMVEVLVEVLKEMRKQYPHPEYDLVFGGSCLQDALRSFPKATNFHL